MGLVPFDGMKIGNGTLVHADGVRVREPKKPQRGGPNGWGVENRQSFIVGPEPMTVLQVKATADMQINGVHVRFFDPEPGFRAEIALCAQEFPVGLHAVAQVSISGRQAGRWIEAREGFACGKALHALYLEHDDDDPLKRKHMPRVVWPQDYWKWIGTFRDFDKGYGLAVNVIANQRCPCKVSISGR